MKYWIAAIIIAFVLVLVAPCAALSPTTITSIALEKPITLNAEKSLTRGDISSVSFSDGASYLTTGDLYIWATPRFGVGALTSPSVHANKAIYSTENVELTYEYTDMRLKESIFIREPIDISFDLSTNGRVVVGSDGIINVFGKNDTVSIIIEKPFAVDSDGKRFDLDWKLDGTLLTLSKIPDDAKYPLMIDPTETVNATTNVAYGGIAVAQNPTTGDVFVQFASSSQVSYIMQRVDATTWIQNVTSYQFGSAAHSIYVGDELRFYSAGNAYLTRAVRADADNAFASGSKTDLNTNFFGPVAAFSNGTVIIPGISCTDNLGIVLAYDPGTLSSTTTVPKFGAWKLGYAIAVDTDDNVLLALNNNTASKLSYLYFDGSWHETSLNVAAEDVALAYDSDTDTLHMLYGTSNAVKYMSRAATVTGGWSEPVTVSTKSATFGSGAGIYHSLDIVLDANGYPHGIYCAGANGPRHVFKNASGGDWYDEQLDTDQCMPQVDAFATDDIHFAWSFYNGAYGVKYYEYDIIAEEEEPESNQSAIIVNNGSVSSPVYIIATVLTALSIVIASLVYRARDFWAILGVVSGIVSTLMGIVVSETTTHLVQVDDVAYQVDIIQQLSTPGTMAVPLILTLAALVVLVHTASQDLKIEQQRDSFPSKMERYGLK